ncbi:unnamed protein product [Leuciscus chuanchicus]
MESDSGRKNDKCDYLVRGELSAPNATTQYLIMVEGMVEGNGGINSLRGKRGTFDTHLCHPPSPLFFHLCLSSVFHPPSRALSLPYSRSLSPSEMRNELVSLRLSEVQIGAQLQKLTSSLQDRTFTPPVVSLSRSLSISLSIPPLPMPPLPHFPKPFLIDEIHWLQKIRSEFARLGCLRSKSALYSKSPNTVCAVGSSSISIPCSHRFENSKCEAVTCAGERACPRFCHRLLETGDRETLLQRGTRSRATFVNAQAHANTHLSLSPLPPAGIFLSQVI